MMDKIKPHMGTIKNWYREPIGKENGLGYVICGDSVDHPSFGGGWIHTSFIVKKDGKEIETRNSRYTLANELGED